MEYICMICGRKQHVLREGQVMLCTRCITALGIALGDKLAHPAGDTKNKGPAQNRCRQ